MTFGAPLPEGDNGARNPGQLGRSYIAPFYANMVSVAEVEDDLGEIWRSTGRIDADEDPDLSNDTSPKSWAEGEKAFKVDWNGVTRPDGPAGVRCFIQLAIYDLPGGDFDLEFNYGLVEPTVMPVNGAEVGFRFGTHRYRHTGRIIDKRQTFRFKFRNGAVANRELPETPTAGRDSGVPAGRFSPRYAAVRAAANSGLLPQRSGEWAIRIGPSAQGARHAPVGGRRGGRGVARSEGAGTDWFPAGQGRPRQGGP